VRAQQPAFKNELAKKLIKELTAPKDERLKVNAVVASIAQEMAKHS
jgi:hypothetical protein